MEFLKKNTKSIIALVSVFFILQAALFFYNTYFYATPDSGAVLSRYALVIGLYSLLFVHLYRLRKARHALSLLVEVFTLALAASALLIIPVVYAKTVGVISEDVGFLYIVQANLLFAVFLAITAYLTKYISFALSKTILLVSLNIVFVINCAAIAILYSTGFEIGPIVFLHFSWTAARVGLGEYLFVVLLIIVFLVPVNIAIARILNTHKDSVVNYAVACLAVVAILINSVVINFDNYKTKTILPVYSILETAVRYSDSSLLDLRKEYQALTVDDRESVILEQLGLNLTALTDPQGITPPAAPKNLIVIYLESFQLDFTRYRDELYPELTPNINALPSDYAVYTNFINSVTPTINAMISSQCGVDIVLNRAEFARESNTVLAEDEVARELLHDNLVCMSDILHRSGYYQVLMKGADIDFSAKGAFFRSHHYDQTLGSKELKANEKYSDLNLWGLQDPMLVDEVLEMLDTLEHRQPFNLSLLTLNSHTPGFEYSGCPVYRAGNAMLNGIHCTDYALGLLLDELQGMPFYENTVVVIVGDHVMFNSPGNQEIFKDIPLSWYGRTFLAIRTPDPSVTHANDIYGITPDLAPTLLELLGFRNAAFVYGQSLMSTRRTHQRIVAHSFDIFDGQMIPEQIATIFNDCPVAAAHDERIYDLGLYTDCQRARIYYLQQKAVLSVY